MTTTRGAWTLAWCGIAGAAVANGGLRERVLVPRLGTLRAHQVSTGVLVTTIVATASVLQRRHPLPDRTTALRVGLGWSAGTLAFELGAGAVRGLPLSDLVADYDLRAGRLWGFVPLTMAVAPVLVERISRRRPAG
ncbi:hypothetical protein [Cellulomonas terrae]|uniref:Uncharacterized protein n=1 Tax=Cellulomonas terrae TaxID=311234 RepID=A0A511JL55_9CELL|nr:hypothetical protein [Cellulomonas terrae]GEL98742.1 hypothetical protein CTE05_22890 [Cellulomonas terrae]